MYKLSIPEMRLQAPQSPRWETLRGRKEEISLGQIFGNLTYQPYFYNTFHHFLNSNNTLKKVKEQFTIKHYRDFKGFFKRKLKKISTPFTVFRKAVPSGWHSMIVLNSDKDLIVLMNNRSSLLRETMI
jgi:hypothetical protein